MEYTVIRINDNNTATVELSVNGNILNQDIDLGSSQAEFTANVETALGVFNSELQVNTPSPDVLDVEKIIGQAQTVTLG